MRVGGSSGHPHDTQKLCYFAWDLEIWESLTPIQRRVLEMVARVDASEDLRSSRARVAYGLKSYATTEYALDALLERGLIDRLEPGRFTVSDVVLFHWLRAS